MLRTRCFICNTGKKTRYKKRIGNGTLQVVDICDKCGDNFNGAGINVPHRMVDNLDALPLLADYTENMPPCEVCGTTTGTEYHHWAPRHVFGDQANRYPGGYLCITCHRYWHMKMAEHGESVCQYCKRLALGGRT